MNESTAARYPLAGRAALVTGASRRRGIGYAIAVGLASLGADLFLHHHTPHDAEQRWGADDLDLVRAGVRAAQRPGAAFGDLGLDLAAPDAPAALVAAARTLTGRLDILVCNHARSGGDGSIFDMTPERLDGHWGVNARSTILLTAEFARAFTGLADAGPGLADPGHGLADLGHGPVGTEPADPDAGGPAQPGQRQVVAGPVDEFATARVFWMTSGQAQGPMPGEVAYAASKAALAGLTATVASELLPHGIILNTINPGPVNSGYLDPETADRAAEEIERVRAAMPFGRYGEPGDPARLIGWLATDAGRWIVGQVITSDGGFAL